MHFDSQGKSNIPIFRIALIGCTGVGKTSIVNQFVNNAFENYYEPTNCDSSPFRKLIDVTRNHEQDVPFYATLIIEDLFGVNNENINKDKAYKEMFIEILKNEPTKNNELNHRLFMNRQIYAYIFVYDYNNKKTLEALEDYMEFVKENETKKLSGGLKTKKYLVANKIDLKEDNIREKFKNKEIDIPKEAEDKRQAYDMSFIATSAKTKFNIDQLFIDVTKSLLMDVKIEHLDKEFSDSIKNLISNKEKVEEKEKKKQKRVKIKSRDSVMCGCGSRRIEDDSEEEKTPIEDERNIDDKSLPYVPSRQKQANCFVF